MEEVEANARFFETRGADCCPWRAEGRAGADVFHFQRANQRWVPRFKERREAGTAFPISEGVSGLSSECLAGGRAELSIKFVHDMFQSSPVAR